MSKNISLFVITSTALLWILSFSNADKPIHNNSTTSPHHTCLHEYFLPQMKADTLSPDFFPKIPESYYAEYFKQYPSFRSDGFDYPVGIPNATGYYKSLNFGEQNHLGEDWNGNGGGNTDLGDPVYVIANGLVIDAKEVCCGWGKVIRVIHKVSDDPTQPFVESVYAHLHTIHVRPGDLIKRGVQIGTIGNAKGRYTAHLHLELRDFVAMSLGPGYSDNTFGYLDPSRYIQNHRP